jgi:hypothetical protein
MVVDTAFMSNGSAEKETAYKLLNQQNNIVIVLVNQHCLAFVAC